MPARLVGRAIPNTTNMPTISKVFVDTNVFVAIRDIKDSTHSRAVKIYEEFKSKKVKFFTSSDVIGETLTVLAKKLGKPVAKEFLDNFSVLTREIFIDPLLHKESRDFFKRVKSKNISFIDCSSAVAMRRNKIKIIFSFDKDFRKLGVKLAADVL